MRGRVETVQSQRLGRPGAGCGRREGSALSESGGGRGSGEPERVPASAAGRGSQGQPSKWGWGEGARGGAGCSKKRRGWSSGCREQALEEGPCQLAREGGRRGWPALFRALLPRALPLPERPAALPSRLSSGPSSPLQSAPWSGRAAYQAAGQVGGRGAQGGQSLGRVSLRLSRAAGLISVLGWANWAGGRLRGPHTTVLTEGSERLSGPVISVGWYCCKIEIHRQGGPLAPTPGARAGPGQGGPASRPTGGRAGAAWGRLGVLLPDPVVLRALRGPGRCPGRLSVCGGGQRRAGGRASQPSL